MIMGVEPLDNNTILTIWSDISQGGVSFWIFMVLFNLTFFKEQWINAVKYVFNKLFAKKDRPSYTKKDLMKHPIFNDLEYWLTLGIEALHIKDNVHPDEDDYINNKEKMAKEVIRIKYETMREALKAFVQEIDLDNLDNDVACAYLMDMLIKENIAQKRRFNERGIPQKFLNKFYMISDISKQIIYNAIKTFFSNNCDSTTSTKMYMAFNTLDGYLNVIFNDLCETVNTINGDLKAEIFDGKPMGQISRIKMLRPPHPTYTMIVKEKLESILKELDGSRAMICKYFEKDGEHYHSVIYETTIAGVTSEIMNIQMINDAQEKNILRIMEESGNIATDISKFDTKTIERFNARGVKAIILVPIYNDDKIDGSLSIDFLSLEHFENTIRDKGLDKKLKEYANSFADYIQYPSNYEF